MNKKQDFSRWASSDEREAHAEAERQQKEQDEVDDEIFEVSWTTSSGQEITIARKDDWDTLGMYIIYVDGRKTGMVRDIIDLQQSPVPGIVAKVGNIGLTAERRDALKKMMR